VAKYTKRNLMHETVRLAAFSGILKAQEEVLGPFFWSLPCILLARALLWDLSVQKGDDDTDPYAGNVIGSGDAIIFTDVFDVAFDVAFDEVSVNRSGRYCHKIKHYSSTRNPSFPS
jgi:hypothetical protein